MAQRKPFLLKIQVTTISPNPAGGDPVENMELDLVEGAFTGEELTAKTFEHTDGINAVQKKMAKLGGFPTSAEEFAGGDGKSRK